MVASEQVRAELMAYAPEGVGPGKPVWAGLQLRHKPQWHTYWRNSGDSGLPTQLEWRLPAGVQAGEIAWPIPKKIPIGTLANYGYEDKVLLPVPLTITQDFKPSLFGGDVEIKLKASWLVCRKECIPEEGEFLLKLPVRSSTAINATDFESAFAAQPRSLPASTQSTVSIAGDSLRWTVAGLPSALQGKTLDFFPETPEVIETAAKGSQAWEGGLWKLNVPLAAQRSNSPAVMPVVLVSEGQGFRAELKVAGSWPQANAAAGAPPQGAVRSGASGFAPVAPTLIAALLGALLGGLILNLMPCVFPVLAIKVVGFAQQAGNRRRHRIDGAAYAAGVIVSFLLLGGLMLALRAGGEQLGWGFQLQSPAFVALLAGLFTAIGLNLAGVFEFNRLVPSAVASLEARHPAANAFLSGVLAVAIASPCTAPFMGASIGLAAGLPAGEALLLFGMVGLGMALPYLGASMVPAVARLLPRPGAWMETFRRLMAFPMFATVAWLVWVLGQQTGIDGAGSLLGLLVLLGMVLWALALRGRARVALATFSIACFALLAGYSGHFITQSQASNGPRAEAGPWQPWEPGRVDQLLATGQPVFVDFTAAWCVTCQYNKKTTLGQEDVLAAFGARNVALLRADWTRRDPAITAALAELGRNGVPVYVFYRRYAAPVVLSEVLSAGEVKAAIAAL